MLEPCQCPDPQEDEEGICKTCGGKAYPTVVGLNRHQMHKPDKCAGHHCSIHNPSDHHMKTWPLLWRRDTLMMERICPHGVGHPDPDHLEFARVYGVTAKLENVGIACPENLPPGGPVCPKCLGPRTAAIVLGRWLHVRRQIGYGTNSVHGCDGCCCPPNPQKGG
jgi:hypothetical protein